MCICVTLVLSQINSLFAAKLNNKKLHDGGINGHTAESTDVVAYFKSIDSPDSVVTCNWTVAINRTSLTDTNRSYLYSGVGQPWETHSSTAPSSCATCTVPVCSTMAGVTRPRCSVTTCSVQTLAGSVPPSSRWDYKQFGLERLNSCDVTICCMVCAYRHELNNN